MASERDIERLSAYIDGELTPTERTTLEAELAQDADLRVELESLRQVVGAIRAMPPVTRRRDFQLTPEMVQTTPKTTPRLLFFPATLPVTALTTAAAVLLIAFGGLILLQSEMRAGTSAPILDAAPPPVILEATITELTPEMQSQQGGLAEADMEQADSDTVFPPEIGAGETADDGAVAPPVGNAIAEESDETAFDESSEDFTLSDENIEEVEIIEPDASRAFEAPPAPAITNDAETFSSESDDMESAEAETLETGDDMAMAAEDDVLGVASDEFEGESLVQEPTSTATQTLTPSPTATETATFTPVPTNTLTPPTAIPTAPVNTPPEQRRAAPDIAPGVLARLLIGLGGLLLMLAAGLLIVRIRSRRG